MHYVCLSGGFVILKGETLGNSCQFQSDFASILMHKIKSDWDCLGRHRTSFTLLCPWGVVHGRHYQATICRPHSLMFCCMAAVNLALKERLHVFALVCCVPPFFVSDCISFHNVAQLDHIEGF